MTFKGIAFGKRKKTGVILRLVSGGLLSKMEAEVDTLCLFAQPKEGQQQLQKQKPTTTDRKSNCAEV